MNSDAELAAGTPTARLAQDDPLIWRTLLLLMLIALGIVAGRIAVVSSANGLTPFLSANDRSRWCTVASLVEDGTYRIDRQMQLTARDPKIKRDVRTWQTIDRVRHQGTDGIYHDYSSKPPLLPTMIAGIYAAAYQVTGMSLTDYPMYMGRLVLALTNLPLLWLFLAPTLSLIHRSGRSKWGRVFCGAATCFGTMLLPFAVTLNNHLPAAAAAAVSLWVLADAGRVQRVSWMLVAGLAGGMLAANELPALCLLVLFAVIALWRSPSAWLLGYLPGVLVVAAGFFGTNWIAHQSLRPPYAHRGNGDLIAELDAAEAPAKLPDIAKIREALIAGGETIDERMGLLQSHREGRYMAATESGNQRYAVVREGSRWQLRHWDDWYEYEGSYWTGDGRSGVDLGEPSRAVYILHTTLGHHGLFSLTPLWLLSIVGAVYWLADEDGNRRALAMAICLASLVCLVFYWMRPLIDRNYGGVSAALRWMMWFAPLWLWLMVPAADRMAKFGGLRYLGGGLLMLSVFSASTALQNPWQHPWLYRIWDYLGWLGG
ncbi:hypothetical protein [Roseimaritima ulvae]|uniref:Glycosyltransferase RgtA/B/C/D-like domain-containing protein n=1 Tax=Roseimaritima ulvae TaxID=980254 RepID=A0A5B9QVS6_9BACT|nr:hypothetical protein [Roseimaritima ulvae]QEG41999.1 hypothetical protein UC8_40280 [Roseimaritima ulvae]